VDFYLDNDVDVGCAPVIRNLGHRCFTTAEAGRQRTEDEDQLIYAHDRGATFVTLDRGIYRRQLAHTMGRLIHFRCEHPDAVDVLDRWLPEVLANLAHREFVIVQMGVDSYDIHAGAWG
jgi:hypothetical protein